MSDVIVCLVIFVGGYRVHTALTVPTVSETDFICFFVNKK